MFNGIRGFPTLIQPEPTHTRKRARVVERECAVTDEDGTVFTETVAFLETEQGLQLLAEVAAHAAIALSGFDERPTVLAKKPNGTGRMKTRETRKRKRAKKKAGTGVSVVGHVEVSEAEIGAWRAARQRSKVASARRDFIGGGR